MDSASGDTNHHFLKNTEIESFLTKISAQLWLHRLFL